ncbi:hypothetical protein BST61_g4315 [Cercospora zeina]
MRAKACSLNDVADDRVEVALQARIATRGRDSGPRAPIQGRLVKCVTGKRGFPLAVKGIVTERRDCEFPVERRRMSPVKASAAKGMLLSYRKYVHGGRHLRSCQVRLASSE